MSITFKIPLSRVYLDSQMKKAAIRALESQRYILGKESESFEEEFAKFIGSKYAVLTSSGTSALALSLLSLGVKTNDEIVVPSFTAFPTVEPVFHVGAKPVFIDIDDSYTIDYSKIEKNISKKTVGIVPVHLYGRPANMHKILKIAKKYNLFVLEDCCQAHNARIKDKKVGSFGSAGCFSFYPSKNMTVCGDGGIVTTSSLELANKIRMLRDHGRKDKYIHEVVGFNQRFNEIQAAIGRVQLKKLNSFTQKRREIAKKYRENLKNLPLIILQEEREVYHAYHLFVIRCQQRDGLKEFLKQNGIDAGIHYPIPCHLQPALKDKFKSTMLPITEKYSKEIISLPIYPSLSNSEIKYICLMIKLFFKLTVKNKLLILRKHK